MIKIRVFRAVDEPATTEKFIEGHMKILKAFGIAMITSANSDWFNDTNTYVIIAESTDGNKVFGGARLQIAGGENILPIEKAISELDVKIHETVRKYEIHGTAEVCGFWNSREVAGLGIGSIFLSRTAIAIAPFLNLKSLFALCAPYTVEMGIRSGFEVATFLGMNGTFYYPKEDLLATAMIMSNTYELPTTDLKEKEEILLLRNNPQQVKTEEGKRGKFEIEYDLLIPNKIL